MKRHQDPGSLPESEVGGHPRAAGKVSRTEHLPPVQRSAVGGAPKPAERGTPAAAHDDPFAMHLIGNEQAGAAAFLHELTADKIVLSPRRLRLERGRPGIMTAMPLSDAVLPPGIPPVPVWCKLLGRDGTSVAELGGHWQPSLAIGPTLTLEVPGPGRYHLELHINAGRPGARVLKRFVFVSAADEEAIAADEGERMHAAAGDDHSDAIPSPTVTTYRDMLAAVLAAQRFTQNGDAKSYAQALQMLEPVADRLYAIYPELLEQRSRRGFGRNVVDQRFGGARDGVRTWIGKLNNSSGIDPDPIVAAFQAAETEIKMGTGEPADLSELRAVDKAAVTTATVAAVGATAIVVAPIAASAVAAVGAELSTSSIGASLYTWAVANPQTALVLSEFLVGMGLGMADQGPENYFKQIETNEDLAWAVMQTLMDLAEARAGMGGGPMDDAPPRGGRRRSDVDLDDVPTTTRPDKAVKRGGKGNKPALENETTSLDGRPFHNDIRKMSPQSRHVIRQLEKRGWVRVDEIHPDDLVDISKWFGREIGVLQSPYSGGLRVVLGTRTGVLTKQLKAGEVFVVHTHPVMQSKGSHFDLDLPSAGKHIEAVVDWSGQITYYSKSGIKNPVRPDGTVEPLLGYEAAFINEDGAIGGFAKIDIIDGSDGATVKVRE